MIRETPPSSRPVSYVSSQKAANNNNSSSNSNVSDLLATAPTAAATTTTTTGTEEEQQQQPQPQLTTDFDPAANPGNVSAAPELEVSVSALVAPLVAAAVAPELEPEVNVTQPDSALLAPLPPVPSAAALSHHFVTAENSPREEQPNGIRADRGSVSSEFMMSLDPQLGEVKKVMEMCVCGQAAAFECSACGQRGYCSARCQRKDWVKHKSACKAAVRNRRSSESTPIPEQPYISSNAATANTNSLAAIGEDEEEEMEEL